MRGCDRLRLTALSEFDPSLRSVLAALAANTT